LAYIRRFIANLSGKIQPFTRLTKKDIPFKWDGECQQAFEEIKAYLLNPPVLAAPISGKELILYTTALDGSLRALLTQENQDGNQNTLYYLSRMMVGAEHGYSPIEKHYLALIFAVKKLRHYMLAYKIILISKVDPLKYLMTRPMLTGRLAKWAIILTEFDITYMPQKAIKGQILADFLAAHPI
jgi:RNase H-like domain found in reverse transcriptase